MILWTKVLLVPLNYISLVVYVIFECYNGLRICTILCLGFCSENKCDSLLQNGYCRISIITNSNKMWNIFTLHFQRIMDCRYSSMITYQPVSTVYFILQNNRTKVLIQSKRKVLNNSKINTKSKSISNSLFIWEGVLSGATIFLYFM